MKQLDGNRSLEIGSTGAANLISVGNPKAGLTSEQTLPKRPYRQVWGREAAEAVFRL